MGRVPRGDGSSASATYRIHTREYLKRHLVSDSAVENSSFSKSKNLLYTDIANNIYTEWNTTDMQIRLYT